MVFTHSAACRSLLAATGRWRDLCHCCWRWYLVSCVGPVCSLYRSLFSSRDVRVCKVRQSEQSRKEASRSGIGSHTQTSRRMNILTPSVAHVHPYDCSRVAANAPPPGRTATSSRRTHREALTSELLGPVSMRFGRAYTAAERRGGREQGMYALDGVYLGFCT